MANLIKHLHAPNGKKITLNTGLFIKNEFTPGLDEKIISVYPADETVICLVEAASMVNVDQAVEAAHAALRAPAWAKLKPSQRSAMLWKLAELIENDREIFATLETWDNGKAYASSLDDVEEAVATLRYYAGWADKIHGQTTNQAGHEGSKFAYTVKQPIGVCALIIPWNYPLEMASWKIGPALACGNTVVLKPAEQTPLSILHMADLIVCAGFPPGVVNIINGRGSIAGQALAEHAYVAKIAFTGSTAVAKRLMQTASLTLKSITVEAGGKSPVLVFEDADVEQAVKWSHLGLMSNQGQICTANSRILVQRSVYESFITRFRAYTEETSIVGDPFASITFQGPQVSKEQSDRVMGFIDRAKAAGAQTILGGERFHCPATNGKGFFIAPTIFTGVTQDMEIFQEEVFGPVAAVTIFEDEEEAVQMANNSRYGLASAIFTSSITRAHRVAGNLEAGMVWINNTVDGDSRVPFGGVKQSGLGREQGEAGLQAYYQVKAVHVNMGLNL